MKICEYWFTTDFFVGGIAIVDLFVYSLMCSTISAKFEVERKVKYPNPRVDQSLTFYYSYYSIYPPTCHAQGTPLISKLCGMETHSNSSWNNTKFAKRYQFLHKYFQFSCSCSTEHNEGNPTLNNRFLNVIVWACSFMEVEFVLKFGWGLILIIIDNIFY